ncbi:hypothetical protein K6119_08475 [Paracrocinitomix mangrovi]|uniref:hypothetical protein n=1 Tax=Paracrocinitomix mangrovi TaxID=2862509 RepID=UPI001C8E53A2|nr:hypothetical protein [Paracrocinitomix mangrovi]UKN03548.1 hypothetical protein K6119_08475 [Paracrocinitomix mangrovi]
MMKLAFLAIVFISTLGYANVNSFTIKLDQFTLYQSQQAINDTIEITKKAWWRADSLHLSAYLCGDNQIGKKATFIARNEKELVFKKNFTNQGLAYEFSFATGDIDPTKIKVLAMTLGADASLGKAGWNYRMGFIRFI